MFANYENMSDQQALELMLSFVLPCEKCGALASKLLGQFDSLAGVLEASFADLERIDQMDDNTAGFVKFCSKLPEIYDESMAHRVVDFSGVKETIEFVDEHLNFENDEYYYFCINGKNELIYYNTMGDFPLGKMFTNNRDMLRQIIKFPTTSVIICHIKPKGEAKPSSWEIRFTRELKTLLSTLSINLVDHIILTPKTAFSFYKIGLLKDNCPKELESKFCDIQMELWGDELRCQSYHQKSKPKKHM